MHTIESPNFESAILTRTIQAGQDDLSPSAASEFLKFSFTPEDKSRMHELAVKNQDDVLTDEERREFESYRRVGRLVDLLTARALQSLAKHARKNQ